MNIATLVRPASQVIGNDLPNETTEARHFRWRSEAINESEYLWPWQQVALKIIGQTRAGSEQLRGRYDDEREAPLTPMYIVVCPECSKTGKGYKNGFPENGRYFICNSCSARFDAHEPISASLAVVAQTARLAWLLIRYKFKRVPTRA